MIRKDIYNALAGRLVHYEKVEDVIEAIDLIARDERLHFKEKGCGIVAEIMKYRTPAPYPLWLTVNQLKDGSTYLTFLFDGFSPLPVERIVAEKGIEAYLYNIEYPYSSELGIAFFKKGRDGIYRYR